MEISVTFRHLEPNDALRDYAREKISRIEKYGSTITEVHAVLSVEKRRHIAEVIVNVNKAQITATEEAEENMYSSIDLVMDKIDRQLKKHKDKLTCHKDLHRKPRPDSIRTDVVAAEEPVPVPDLQTRSVPLQRMAVADAVRRMDGGSDDLIVFCNDQNEKLTILYRRRNGDLGLVEPENV